MYNNIMVCMYLSLCLCLCSLFTENHIVVITECGCITGTTNGSVLVYKLNTSCLYKELCIHNHRIQGVEWLNLQALVTFVHSIPNSNGLCRNEAAVTDIQTGLNHFL